MGICDFSGVMWANCIGGCVTRALIAATFVCALAFPFSAYAETPQQALHAYLVRQAGKSQECPRLPATNQYCNPAPVTGTAADATKALQIMRNVETLGVMCSGGDTNACLRQGAFRDAAGKLGWCARPTIGMRWENVIVWAKCSGKPVIINRAN